MQQSHIYKSSHLLNDALWEQQYCMYHEELHSKLLFDPFIVEIGLQTAEISAFKLHVTGKVYKYFQYFPNNLGLHGSVFNKSTPESLIPKILSVKTFSKIIYIYQNKTALTFRVRITLTECSWASLNKGLYRYYKDMLKAFIVCDTVLRIIKLIYLTQHSFRRGFRRNFFLAE